MIDLFASGFVFKIDDQGGKKKKTTLGQALTFVILILSAIYFVFIFYQFVEKINPPTIIDETLIQNNAFEYDFTYSPMHIRVNVADDAVNLDEYFTFWNIIETGKEVIATLLQKCSVLYPNDSSYDSDEYCIEKETAKLKVNRSDSQDYINMKVVIAKCDEGMGRNGEALGVGEAQVFSCKQDSDIQNFIHQPQTFIEVTTIFYELDHNNGLLEEKDDIQKIFLDHQLLLHHHVIIKVAESDVDSHPFWTSHDTFFYAYDYKASSYFYSEDFAQNKFDERVMHNALYINEMILDSNLLKHTIQYEKFAEMMAKFFSLFNTVILIGVIGSMTSEAKILECTMDTYLREYYKTTAYDLHTKKELEEIQKEKIKMQKEGQKIEPIDDEIANQEIIHEKLPDIPTEEQILDISSFRSLYLNNMAKIILKKQQDKRRQQIKESKMSQSLSRQKSATKSLAQQVDDIDELQDEKEPESYNSEKLYLRMYKETQTATQFRQLYSEILNLKTQMQVLLSEEQYAASFYLNRRLCFSKDLSSKNHLERQDQVQLNEMYRRKLIFNFIEKFEKKEYQDEASQRLYDCLLQDVKDMQKAEQQKGNVVFSKQQSPDPYGDVEQAKKGSIQMFNLANELKSTIMQENQEGGQMQQSNNDETDRNLQNKKEE